MRGLRTVGSVFALALSGLAPCCALAATRVWIPPLGGTFDLSSNWQPAGLPQADDLALFDAGGAYTVNFKADRRTARLRIGNDKVTFDLGGHHFSLADDTTTSLEMGLKAGQVSRMTLRDGRLSTMRAVVGLVSGSDAHVTVSSGGLWTSSDMLAIGHGGDGGLTLLGGGRVQSGSGRVGFLSGSTANVLITGTGSSWRVANGLQIGSNGGGAASVDIHAGGYLRVAGDLELRSTGSLTLDGGTVAVGSLKGIGRLTFNSGRLRVFNSASLGANSRLGTSVTLNAGRRLDIDQVASISAGSSLVIEDGVYTAGRTVNAGRIHLGGLGSVLNSGSVLNRGTILGAGRIRGTLDNTSTAKLLVEADDRMVFDGSVTNGGRINLAAGGVLHFKKALAQGGTGRFTAAGAVYAGEGLDNAGLLTLTDGAALYGDLRNLAGGRVSASGSVLIGGDCDHDGTNFSVAGGGLARFLGSVSGSGDFLGPGDVSFATLYSPGDSPDDIRFNGNVSFDPGARLLMEIAGTIPGSQHDRLTVARQITLGPVDVVFQPGYVPRHGDQFTLVSAGQVIYGPGFRVNLPALPPGMDVEVSAGPRSLVLTTIIPEPSAAGLVLCAWGLMLSRRRRA